jgi:hypothetical protein
MDSGSSNVRLRAVPVLASDPGRTEIVGRLAC